MRCRTEAWRPCVWTIAALAIPCSSAFGQSRPPSGDARASVTASNQSVALESTGQGSPSAPAGSSVLDAASSAPSAAHSGPESSTAMDEPRADREAPRRLRRSTAAATGEDGAAAPWYRTSFGATGVVLALIGSAYYAARRFLPALATQESRGVRVLSRAALTPRQSVALVAVGQRVLVVGIGTESVRLLVDVSDPVEASELVARSGARDVKQARAFEQALEREVVAFERESAAARTDVKESRPLRGLEARRSVDEEAVGDALDDGPPRGLESSDPVEQLRSRLRALRTRHGVRSNRVA